MRTGIAHLPLHYGKAPAWLFSRMRLLARQVTLAIVEEYGPREMLVRLADPFWFQAFGCVLGFDWHSSGLTTTVCGALKEGIKGLERQIGLCVCGGKGRVSRKTPDEVTHLGGMLGMDPAPLVYASRMSAKVDNTALQDGYQLYHHNLIFTGEGEWAVIQQGMNETNRYARRYHWLGSTVEDFVCEPHSAVCCDSSGEVLNMVAKESDKARDASATISREHPERIMKEFTGLRDQLTLPREHPVPSSLIHPNRLKKVLLSTYEQQPQNFASLLGMPGVGPKTIRSLSLLSEILYGAKASFRDPVRFSFAHGGKDGHPYPVDRANYDRSIDFLKRAVDQARIGRTERLHALKRLGNLF
ncbi:MAG: DUF763 domain-containing protein [bacterium]